MSLLGRTSHWMAVALLAPPMASMSVTILGPGFKLRPLGLGGTEGGWGGSLLAPQTDRKGDTKGGRKAGIAACPWGRVIVLCMIAMTLMIHSAPRALQQQRDGRAMNGWQTVCGFRV
jgi:hypothetical protein